MEAIAETEKAAEVQLPGGNGQDRAVDMKQIGRQSEVQFGDGTARICGQTECCVGRAQRENKVDCLAYGMSHDDHDNGIYEDAEHRSQPDSEVRLKTFGHGNLKRLWDI